MCTMHAHTPALTHTSQNLRCFRIHAVIDYLFILRPVTNVLRHHFVLSLGIRTLPMSENADRIKLVEGSLLQLLNLTRAIQ